jgi:hypothetical protein
MEVDKKTVELLKSVLIIFKQTYMIDPKPFLNILIAHYGSAAHKYETEGFNEAVCEKVFQELYPKG